MYCYLTISLARVGLWTNWHEICINQACNAHWPNADFGVRPGKRQTQRVNMLANEPQRLELVLIANDAYRIALLRRAIQRANLPWARNRRIGLICRRSRIGRQQSGNIWALSSSLLMHDIKAGRSRRLAGILD